MARNNPSMKSAIGDLNILPQGKKGETLGESKEKLDGAAEDLGHMRTGCGGMAQSGVAEPSVSAATGTMNPLAGAPALKSTPSLVLCRTAKESHAPEKRLLNMAKDMHSVGTRVDQGLVFPKKVRQKKAGIAKPANAVASFGSKMGKFRLKQSIQPLDSA